MQNKSFPYTLSLAAGAALPLAFAPFHLSPLAILSPAILLYGWLHFYTTAKQSFISGLMFGLGVFTVGASWVYISIHTYGQASTPLAFLITALFVFALALFPALQGYLFHKITPNNNLNKTLLVFPASWAIFEWLRTFVLSGFPWLFLGYSQINTPLQNLAPFVGVYGVSWAVALTSALLVCLILEKDKTRKIIFIVTLGLLWFVSGALYQINEYFVKPKGSPIRVSLIQGNIPLETKWDSKQIPAVLQTYAALSAEHWQSSLIVWPEAAIPALQWQVTDYLKNLQKSAKTHNSTIVSGIIFQDEKNKKYYNSMISMGVNNGLYLKKRLVPFGEFLPLQSYLSWLLNFLHIPWSNLTPGMENQPKFVAANLAIAPFICYEIAYPYLALRYFPYTDLLVTISEDSWFGRSLAAEQQLEIARMRSLETGRYQVVSSNNGLTAIINQYGKLEAKIPAFQQAVLTGEVYAMEGITPWVNYGYYLWIVAALCSLGVGIARNGKNKTKKVK